MEVAIADVSEDSVPNAMLCEILLGIVDEMRQLGDGNAVRIIVEEDMAVRALTHQTSVVQHLDPS